MKKLFTCAITAMLLLCACANGNENFDDRFAIDSEDRVEWSATAIEETETEPIETDAPIEVTETEPETIADTTPETLPAIVTPTTPAVVDVPIETEPIPVVVETVPPVPETVAETEPESTPVVIETEPSVPETELETVAETEPETTPETEVPTEITYVLNKNSKKFHLPTCASAKKIKAENYEAFTGTREEAIAAGYDPCKKCKP